MNAQEALKITMQKRKARDEDQAKNIVALCLDKVEDVVQNPWNFGFKVTVKVTRYEDNAISLAIAALENLGYKATFTSRPPCEYDSEKYIDISWHA